MAELAGLALGVPPLLTAAVRSYSRATVFFRSVKDYPRKLREAVHALRMQELCFRKANEKVLCQFTDPHEATQMLRDASHPAWRDQSVSTRYIALFGGDIDTFKAAIDLICNRLDIVQAKFKELAPHPKSTIQAARKRVNFAFKESRVADSIRDLTEKTQNFIALINLVTSQTPSYDGARVAVSPSGLRGEMQRSAAVKKTAEDLYGALGAACTEHDNHQAHINLAPVCSSTYQVRFTLAFSQRSISAQDLNEDKKPLWLTVESSFDKRSEASNDESEGLCSMATTLKRTLVRFQDEEDDQGGHSVPTRKASYPNSQNTGAGSATLVIRHPAPVPVLSVVNLCKKGKICHHLAQVVNLTLPGDQAIGYLKTSPISKHLIYLDCGSSTTTSVPISKDLRSLNDALRKGQDDATQDAFSFDQRLLLAKQLAQAVLHFHKTAWLQDSWDSRTILLSRSKDISSLEPTASPSLEVFASTHIHNPTAKQDPVLLAPNPLVIRNRLLFNLGVVLLELAYEKPLTSMIDPLDRVGILPQDVPYRTADRLSKRVSSKCGPKYAETVRKCLHCDFGQGFDFEKACLQEAFYRSIICELGVIVESISI